MISLILPYWNRQEAADRALTLLSETYFGLDMEVIVVDDGSGFIKPDLPIDIVVVTLPAKDEPKCPCTAWNAGVKASKGSYIVLSCIEILHETPVLQEMRNEVDRTDGYVLAAAWCPDFHEWHCHSSVEVPTCPPNTGIAFCAMLKRDLWDKSGGFDEDYREGAGYEDRDFINRLYTVGAKFIFRDDLVVIHPKSGATTEWKAGGFNRNEALYYSKWKSLTEEVWYPSQFYNIVCVNWGNYCGRGAEYVNNLYDMVRRNSPEKKWAFTCFTDNPEGLSEGIKTRPLKHDLTGWDNKIALFEDGLFTKGERVIFLDLDTVIIGDISDLFNYNGSLATLRDFWRPEGLGPAIILWEAGKNTELWDDYVKESPTLERGDQEWLENNCKPEILQDLYPGKFISYKTHCNPYPTPEASIVCFHGNPRPHECTQQWVKDTWRVGGSSRVQLNLAPNTDNRTVFRNIELNKDKAPWISVTPEHSGDAVIVGSGPSLLDTLQTIRDYQSNGAVIFALNNAAKTLFDNGIEAQCQIVMDARESNLSFVAEPYAKSVLLAAQVHPSLFDACKGTVYQWHPYIDGIEEIFPDEPMTLIGGGTTVGLSSMALVYAMGYRKIHLFGYDSSFRGEQLHATPQERTEAERQAFDVTVFDKTFSTNAAMAKQAEIFPLFINNLAENGVLIYVYGDGLLPHIAHNLK